MTANRKRIAIAAIVGVVAWFGVVFGEIHFKCRKPDSEACSWAHAFFPELTVPLFFVIIGFPAFVIAYVIAGRWFSQD